MYIKPILISAPMAFILFAANSYAATVHMDNKPPKPHVIIPGTEACPAVCDDDDTVDVCKEKKRNRCKSTTTDNGAYICRTVIGMPGGDPEDCSIHFPKNGSLEIPGIELGGGGNDSF